MTLTLAIAAFAVFLLAAAGVFAGAHARRAARRTIGVAIAAGIVALALTISSEARVRLCDSHYRHALAAWSDRQPALTTAEEFEALRDDPFGRKDPAPTRSCSRQPF